MSKWKLSVSAHLPASPYFSNSDDQHHKPKNFQMVALDSSHNLHDFCIQVKAKNEVLVARWQEVATPYFIFPKMNFGQIEVCTQINVLQPPSVFFQFKIIIIIIKSASKDLFTSLHALYIWIGVDNQIFKNQQQYVLEQIISILWKKNGT